jgi:hypothetical protein
MSEQTRRTRMLIVISVAAAATLAVVAFAQIQRRSPEAGTAGLRMVRELAAVVLVCTKAVEGIVDVLSHQRVQPAPVNSGWGYRSSYRDDEDER